MLRHQKKKKKKKNESVGDLKAWLTGQLHCWVGQQHLQNYQGVVGSFLMDLALPITIYLLDYFLPQLAPTEHCVDTLDVMAAPIRYSPQPMTFTLLRERCGLCILCLHEPGWQCHGHDTRVCWPVQQLFGLCSVLWWQTTGGGTNDCDPVWTGGATGAICRGGTDHRYQASKQARKAQKSGPGCPSNARLCKRSDPVQVQRNDPWSRPAPWFSFGVFCCGGLCCHSETISWAPNAWTDW